jgi:hypothetical protein
LLRKVRRTQLVSADRSRGFTDVQPDGTAHAAIVPTSDCLLQLPDERTVRKEKML